MVSIIIPTLGRASIDRLLRSILQSARSQSIQLDRDFEIVVCVDARGSLALGAEFAGARVIASNGPGVNRARNSGARAARGDLLWFLDDDTEILAEASLVELPRFFSDANLCASGGDYVSRLDAGIRERGYNSLCSLWRFSAGVPHAEQMLGGTLAVRKSAWQAAGGFDDHIEYGGAETSFVIRLTKLGRVEFHEVLNVWHSPGDRSMRAWARIASLQGRRKVETETSLPGFLDRASRTLQFLSRQKPLTLVSLTCFAVPFLTVSKAASIFRR